MALVDVSCSHCGTTFQIKRKKRDWSAKRGRNVYCTPTCLRVAHTTSKIVPCTTCGVPVTITKKLQGRASGQWFCSRSCAAKVTSRRPHSEVSKIRASESLRIHPIRLCPHCGVEITNPRFDTCSRVCRKKNLGGEWYPTKETVLVAIQRLAGAIGHTPTNRFNHRLTNSAVNLFGSWNKAVVESGLTKNIPWAGHKRIPCVDGHIADSLSEKMLDDWFHHQGIRHERRKPYPEGRFNCDFYLPDQDLWVEYFGLIGLPFYDKKVNLKKQMATQHRLRLIGITPDMLYPFCTLSEEIFKAPIS